MFVAGLHFGTQYTSVAFAHSDSPDNVHLVKTWPSGATGNLSSHQVPTQIEYEGPTMRWGYEVSNSTGSSVSLRFLNLLLVPPDGDPQSATGGQSVRTTPLRVSVSQSDAPSEASEAAGLQALSSGTQHEERSSASAAAGRSLTSSPAYIPVPPPVISPLRRNRQVLTDHNISAVTAVADFLSKVRETTLGSIERCFELQQIQAQRGVKWILTVLGIFDDSAKERMAHAARQAGFGELGVDFELVNELECLATCTLKLMPYGLWFGDTFVLCDAGEGPVDLITCRVTRMSPLCVDRVVPQSGALCGSVLLDRGLEDYVRRRFGEGVFKPKSKAAMMRSWKELITHKFWGRHSFYDILLPGVPDDPAMNVVDNYHTMEYEDIKNIFDPVVDRIAHLISCQVREAQDKGNVTAILLVGGFGASRYLQKCLEDQYGGQAIPVLQPLDANHRLAATARGALIRGVGYMDRPTRPA